MIRFKSKNIKKNSKISKKMQRWMILRQSKFTKEEKGLMKMPLTKINFKTILENKNK